MAGGDKLKLLTLAEVLNQRDDNNEFPELNLTGTYVDLEESVRWIAHGTFGHLGVGPQMFSHFDIETIASDYSALSGREDLARELLLEKLVEHGVALWGVLAEGQVNRSDFQSEPEFSMANRLRIPAEMIADLEFGSADDPYQLEEFGFDLLLLPRDFLSTHFRPHRVPCEETRNEKISPSPYEGPKVSDAPPIPLRGRPRKWDWDWLTTEIVALANTPDGLPEKQAELESWAAQRFLEKYGAEPANSLIRKKLGPIYRRLRSKS